MILKKLLESLDYELVSGNLNVDVEKVVCDSNAVIQKSAFIAIPGYKVDGHNYISTAISKGAKVIILEQEPKKIFNEITYIKIPNTRMGLSQIANNFYKNPSSKLKVIGITGTNGKTSTSMIPIFFPLHSNIFCAIILVLVFPFVPVMPITFNLEDGFL